MSAPVGTPTTAPGGWYPDPTTPGMSRWWTGTAWSSHVMPSTTESDELGFLVPKRSSLGTRALVWGLIALVINALFLPSILAIVYGAMALSNASRVQRSGGVAPATGSARAGLILGIIALVVDIVAFVALQLWLHP